MSIDDTIDATARIVDEDGLRQIYRQPSQRVIDKAVDRIDDGAAAFLARSTLCIVATGDGGSIDASPRGGPPGFVEVLDRRTVAFGDLTGNNRLDTYTNLLSSAAVGIICIVPGMEETLRINGSAAITVDEDVRTRCAIDGRVPKVAVIIDVEECYLHCGAALRRAALWDVDSWPGRDERPSAGTILTENLGLDGAAADGIDAGLAEYYDNGVWKVGGHDD